MYLVTESPSYAIQKLEANIHATVLGANPAANNTYYRPFNLASLSKSHPGCRVGRGQVETMTRS